MHIGITGATGLIGTKIIDLALRRGHEIVAFSRNPERSVPGCEMRPFKLSAVPDLRGCEAVVHLAGESVVGVWTAARKRRIRESRILGTRQVVTAIAALEKKPEVFLSGSAIGIYGDQQETELTESAPAGRGFLAETVTAWEAETRPVADVRTVLLRTSVVLAREGGALPAMCSAFRWGLGGVLGSGEQWMSWIHLEDLAQLALFAVENLDVQGVVHGAAPWPVRQKEFARVLARTLRRPAFWHVPGWALKALLGGFSAEILESKRVLPSLATEHGFRFQFPELEGALKNLLP